MALTSTEKARAFRERMKAQGLTSRTVYLPQGEPTPTPEEMTAFLEWRKARRLQATGEESGNDDAERLAVTAPKDTGIRLQLTKESAQNGERLAVTSQEGEPDQAAILPTPNRKVWAERAKVFREAATQGETKRVAKEADHSNDMGVIEGVCKAAVTMIKHGNLQGARDILKENEITHDQAEAALYPDHRRRTSVTLLALENAQAWGKV
jgi:hypothetical protein